MELEALDVHPINICLCSSRKNNCFLTRQIFSYHEICVRSIVIDTSGTAQC